MYVCRMGTWGNVRGGGGGGGQEPESETVMKTLEEIKRGCFNSLALMDEVNITLQNRQYGLLDEILKNNHLQNQQ